MNINESKLTVSLVTYNAEKYLPYCLPALFDQTFKDFNLIIIDNGSSDDTVRFIKENYPQYRIVSHKENIGFAKAHNQAIAWSKSDYVCLLNQDILLEPEYLAECLEFMERKPQAAAVSGKILTWDFETNQRSRVIDSLGLKIFKNHRVVDKGQGKLDSGDNQEPQEIFGVSGAVPVYRRSALEKIKIISDSQHQEYFDELFFAYKEDVDLAYRLRLAGQEAYFLPTAVAYHDRSVKAGADLSDKAMRQNRRKKNRMVKVYSYKNHFLTLFKNEFKANLLKYFFPVFWFELKKFIYLMLFEQSTLKGLSMYFSQRQKMKQKRKYIIKNIRKISAKELAQWYESR